MMGNEMDTLELWKWLSKAIIEINWFSAGVQVGIIFVEHIHECKFLKPTSYYICDKTPKHIFTDAHRARGVSRFMCTNALHCLF